MIKNMFGIDQAQLVPRWEWRYFSHDQSELDQYFKDYTPYKTETSEQIYFLLSNPDLNVKYRHGMIDVKQLQNVNKDGFELWLPIFKSSTPMNQSDMIKIAEIMGLDYHPVTLGKEPQDILNAFQQFDDVTAISLRKERKKFSIDDVSGELAVLEFNQVKVCTIALEDEESFKIRALRSKLQIHIDANMNYPTALRQYNATKSQR